MTSKILSPKAVQYFTDEYLEYCKSLTPLQIVEFLESYAKIYHQAASQPSQSKDPTKSRLISIKIPEDLLLAFKLKAEAGRVRYQTQIKKLMREWLLKP